jgi:hypothetical protein
MDSTGLVVLIRAAETLGHRLRIVCDRSGRVQRLFEVACAEPRLPLHPSRDAAEAAH